MKLLLDFRQLVVDSTVRVILVLFSQGTTLDLALLCMYLQVRIFSLFQLNVKSYLFAEAYFAAQ